MTVGVFEYELTQLPNACGIIDFPWMQSDTGRRLDFKPIFAVAQMNIQLVWYLKSNMNQMQGYESE